MKSIKFCGWWKIGGGGSAVKAISFLKDLSYQNSLVYKNKIISSQFHKIYLMHGWDWNFCFKVCLINLKGFDLCNWAIHFWTIVECNQGLSHVVVVKLFWNPIQNLTAVSFSYFLSCFFYCIISCQLICYCTVFHSIYNFCLFSLSLIFWKCNPINSSFIVPTLNQNHFDYTHD